MPEFGDSHPDKLAGEGRWPTSARVYEISDNPHVIVHRALSSGGRYLMIVKEQDHSQHTSPSGTCLKLELWDLSESVLQPTCAKSYGTLCINDLEPRPYIVFSQDLSTALIANQLYRISWDSSNMSVTHVQDLKRDHSTVRWIVCHEELVFVASVEPLELEDDPTFSGEDGSACPDHLLRHQATLAAKYSVICDRCQHSCSPSSSYSCLTCGSDGARYDLCYGCLRRGLWCIDTTHVLRSRVDETKTLDRRDTHSLSIVNLNDITPTRKYLFSTWITTSVYHCPLIAGELEELVWFLDASHVLLYNYKNGGKRIVSIRNMGLESGAHIYTNISGPYLFVFSTESRWRQAWSQGNARLESSQPVDKCISVRVASYDIRVSKESQELRALWSTETQIQGIRSDSDATMTLGPKRADLAYISSSGAVICQEFRYMIALRQKELPGLTEGQYTTREMSLAALDDYPRIALEAPSSVTSHFTGARYLPEDSNEGKSRLVLWNSPERLPIKVDWSLTSGNGHGLSDTAKPLFTENKSLETPHQATTEGKPASVPAQDWHQNGALCQRCSAIINSSVLLNASDHWESVPLSELDHNYFHAPIRDHKNISWPYIRIDPGSPNANGADEVEGQALKDGGLNGVQQQGAQNSGTVQEDFLYEHHTFHTSQMEFSLSILRGCHLCCLFLATLEPDQREAILRIVNNEARKSFSCAEGHFNEKTFPRFPMFAPKEPDANCSSLLTHGDGVEWMTHLRGFLVRIKALSKDRTSYGEICLYESLGDGGEPGLQAKVKLGVAREFQDGADNSSSQQPHSLRGSPIDQMRFTDSEEAINLARGWLDECRITHWCTTPGRRARAPTRVIDVGPPNGAQAPRLYKTTPDDDGMHYLTLSHCWGQGNTFILTKSNLEAWTTRGVAIADFPETFRDAVMVCRRLQQRYLWIDSLCIIQEGDNGEDWAREAPKMASVYGESLCTIAALSSTSVRSGCFSACNTLSWEPLLFYTNSGLSFITENLGSDGLHAREHHLNSRGWAFQERILSPRILGFSSAGLSWQCSCLRATARHPRGINPHHLFAFDIKAKEMFQQATTPLLQPLPDDSYRISFLTAWYDLVQEYSRMDLTIKDDKLVALAGISETIQRATGFMWYYGLWHDAADRQMLLSQLLWTCQYEDLQDDRPPNQEPAHLHHPRRAPTFSWAAMRSPVDYRITFHARHIEPDANKGDYSRPSFWVPVRKKDAFYLYQCMCRFKGLYVRGGAEYKNLDGSESAKALLEFRAEILSFVSPEKLKGQPSTNKFPQLLLRGPVRRVTLRSEGSFALGDKDRRHEHTWRYPWTDQEGEIDNGGDFYNHGKTAWFFPDTQRYAHADGAEVMCITIARWKRSWNDRWYCAGLVLEVVGEFSRHGSWKQQGLLATREGYFEHSWSHRHPHWEDDGEEKLILLA